MGEPTVNEVFYSTFTFKSSFLFRSFSITGVNHHLTTFGGISNITTNYWIENLHLLLDVSIKEPHMNFNTAYIVTCSMDWNNFEKDKNSFGNVFSYNMQEN